MKRPTRKLGATGYVVSELGFGGWGLGGSQWRGVDDGAGREALREAVDQGITFFDTALAYGDGHSERLMGQVLKPEIHAGRVVVATKIPPLNEEWPGRAGARLADVFPAGISRRPRNNHSELGVEALPLQQLHVWHDAWLNDPEWEASHDTIVRLKREGKVLHWGISINDHAPETALRALEDAIFETAQVIYNIYDRSPERALFELARTKPLGVIVRVPFDEGALTGQIRSDTVFSRRRLARGILRPVTVAPRPSGGESPGAALDDQVETLPELALRFCLSSPRVATVIPGMRRAAHVRQNVAAATKGALPPGMLAKLEAHAWDKNWYSA